MAAKRNAKPPRAIPVHRATGTADAIATAQDRFYRDLDDTSQYQIIRDRKTGEVFDRRTLTATECIHEVALRNAGVPLNPISQGKLLKPGRKVKSDDPSKLSATEWVERLMGNPPTAEKLRMYKPTGTRALSSEDLFNLMIAAAPHGLEIDEEKDEDLLSAVMQQLYRNFRIGHKR